MHDRPRNSSQGLLVQSADYCMRYCQDDPLKHVMGQGTRLQYIIHWTLRHQLDLLNMKAPKGRDIKTGLARSMGFSK